MRVSSIKNHNSRLWESKPVKSSTPEPCREKIKEGLKIIMNGTEKELNTFIQKFREEFMTLPPEEIAYPRSVNGLSKFSDSNQLFAKGAPIHVKGAILYNHLVRKNKLGNKYPYILEGDKIKFINLKQPNIYQCSSISFITSLPKELDFHKIIDYDVQFEKSFIEPLNFILQKINWLVDRSYGTQGTLEDFCMILNKQDSVYVAMKMMKYFKDFNRIDDYFRARKIERVKDIPSSAWHEFRR